MLKKILSTLDESVFTEEVKQELHESFEDAVNAKAQFIVEEKIEQLEDKSQEYVDFLESKAEEYVQLKESALLDRIDEYLERIVEEFVSEASDSLEESVKTKESELIREAFETMVQSTGVEFQKTILENADDHIKSEMQDLKNRYNEAVNNVFELKRSNSELLKMGVITEMCENLTLIQADRFKSLVQDVEFTESVRYLNRLESIKESVLGLKVGQTEGLNTKEASSLNESATKNTDFGNLFSFGHLV